MPLLILAAVAAYLFLARPDVIASITSEITHGGERPAGSSTPMAQFLLPTDVAPMGSAVNPRIMTYTTFAVQLPPGTTRGQADQIILNRGSNIPMRDFGFDESTGEFYMTVITDDAPQLSQFTGYANSIPGALSVRVVSSRPIKYYLLANNWVSELDYDAFIADCPRQKLLNPGVGFGECPTA